MGFMGPRKIQEPTHSPTSHSCEASWQLEINFYMLRVFLLFQSSFSKCKYQKLLFNKMYLGKATKEATK